MNPSIFLTLKSYFFGVFRGFRSVFGSLLTVFPYLFGLGENRKEVTEQYPDPISSKTEDDLPPRSRGLLYNDIDRCTGCGQCAEICPAQCIHVIGEPGPESSKKWVSVFDIDFSRCMFCGLCVEVCQPASLFHTKQYEGAVYSVSNLTSKFGRGYVTEEQRQKWDLSRQSEEMDF